MVTIFCRCQKTKFWMSLKVFSSNNFLLFYIFSVTTFLTAGCATYDMSISNNKETIVDDLSELMKLGGVETEKQSIPPGREPMYTVDNGIMFSRDPFGYVRRPVLTYSGTVKTGNIGHDESLITRKISVKASGQPVVNVTEKTGLVEEKMVEEAGAVKVETDAVGKVLEPVGDIVEKMEELQVKIDEFRNRIFGRDEEMSPEEGEEWQKLIYGMSPLMAELESKRFQITITLDLPRFPELEEAGGRVEILVEVELETAEGERIKAREVFTLDRHPPLPHR